MANLACTYWNQADGRGRGTAAHVNKPSQTLNTRRISPNASLTWVQGDAREKATACVGVRARLPHPLIMSTIRESELVDGQLHHITGNQAVEGGRGTGV